MSTLKTHNLQSPDAASVNIALAPNNGMVVAGISTFNNRVLIGTNIEGHADADDLTIGSSTNTAGITIRTNTSGTGRLWFSDGTSGAAEYQGYVQYDHNNQRLSLGSGGTTKLHITSSGDLSLNTTTQNAYLGLKASSTAINTTLGSTSGTSPRLYLKGTGNGQSDAGDVFIGSGTGGIVNIRSAELMKFEVNSDNSTLEALRIDSNGRLLVGTTTEGHAAADELTISNTTSAADMGITLRSATNGQGAIYFSDGTSGADEYRGIINYNHTNNFFSFFTNASEKVRIDSSGYLIAKADIRLRRTASDNGALYFGDTNNNYIFGSDADDLITFATAANERLRITSAGKVGINETNPNAMLHVENNNAHSGTYYLNTDAAILIQNKNSNASAKTVLKLEGPVGGGDCALVYGSSSTNLIIADRQHERMRISSAGHVTKPTHCSFKSNISGSYGGVGSLTTTVANVGILLAGEEYDRGNNYNTTSKLFTCPVDGIYMVSVFVSLGNVGSSRHIFVIAYTNGGGSTPLQNYFECIDGTTSSYANYSYCEPWYFTSGTTIGVGKNGHSGYNANYQMRWGVHLLS